MTEQQFLQQAEKAILTDIAVTSNQLMSLSKTAALSIGLFSKLAINFTATQSDLVEFNKKLTIDQLVDCVGVNFDNTNQPMVEFTFLYTNEKHLKHLLKAIEKNLMFFSHHYLVQVQYIIRKYYTDTYQAMMFKRVRKKEQPFLLIELAKQLSVNSFLNAVYNQSTLYNAWADVKDQFLLPNFEYDGDFLTDIDAINHVKSTADKCKIKKITTNLSEVSYYDITYITQPKQSAQPKFHAGGMSQSKQSVDLSLSSLAESVTHHISSSTQGTGIGNLLNTLFDSINVPCDWFRELNGTLSNSIGEKYDRSHQTWDNLDCECRHIYKAPTYDSQIEKVQLIISRDVSASVSTNDTQQFLSIIEQNSDMISSVYVVDHTTGITAEHTISHPEDIQQHPAFKQAFSARSATGGTSHRAAFDAIESYLSDKNPSQFIYISFGDNYSDVESLIHKYPLIQSTDTIWLTTSDGRVMNQSIVGGRTIVLP